VDVPEAVAEIIVREPVIGHLATSFLDMPHVTPVWLDYDAVSRTIIIDVESSSFKLKNMMRNSNVCLSFTSPSDSSKWAVISGVVKITELGEDCAHIQTLALKYLGRPKGCPSLRSLLSIDALRVRWWSGCAVDAADTALDS
jgi:nitroimidazol reductase NimA-like FMN-containing flavoprotein (pyridoxamine 5'-phosphate oxidase superfamily)